ncbi:MAG: glycosyltransferase family 2 protein [Chthoniobacterales bacterium]
MLPVPLSVCIPVRNEGANLPACLEALNGAVDELVVVDSGSTDDTQKIAREFGATVLDFKWNGSFPKKRNWALRNHTFRNPWVLFLDADERVTPAFLNELRETLPGTDHAGFWIYFHNWFMGRPLKHGDVFCKLALFRIGTGEYERFPEDSWSHLDMEVHEYPILEGSVGEIHGRLEHREDRGLAHYIAKHEAYAEWETKRFQWLQTASPEEWAKFTPRQRFKYKHLNDWWLGPLFFLITYFLKRGFLDGKAGGTFARLKCRYFMDIRRKIRTTARG